MPPEPNQDTTANNMESSAGQLQPDGSTISTVGYPFHQYVPTLIEPCAVDAENQSQPFHLLSCGHLAAVLDKDQRCGLNCLHVVNRMAQQQFSQHGHVPAGVLAHATSILPPVIATQGRDHIYCEICTGIPVGSFALLNAGKSAPPERRAFSLTRNVVEHFTPYTLAQIEALQSPLFYNPAHQPFDWKCTHMLRCGHEVWCDPVRPCASNCGDANCRGRIFPGNHRQADAIICKECTYRAEVVYLRYNRAADRHAQVGIDHIADA